MSTLDCKSAVRSAEKARSSSCTFADEVAKAVINLYKKTCPHELKQSYKQTVLAGFVLLRTPQPEVGSTRQDQHSQLAQVITTQNRVVTDTMNIREGSDMSFHVTVLSIGVGTKSLSLEAMRSLKHTDNTNNLVKKKTASDVIKDCHAEILARRGFLAWLSKHIQDILIKLQQGVPPAACSNVFDVHLLNKEGTFSPTQEIGDLTDLQQRLRLSLRHGYTLHLYSSSQPCGNACLKKWASITHAPIAYPTPYTGWETCYHASEAVQNAILDLAHAPFVATARKDGQIACMVKRSTVSSGMEQCTEDTHKEIAESEQASHMNKTARNMKTSSTQTTIVPTGVAFTPIIPSAQQAAHMHASTAAVPMQGILMSCSDKIGRWNCVGIQGGRLASFFDLQSVPLHAVETPPDIAVNNIKNPNSLNQTQCGLYLSSIIIGRKYSRPHLQRALCCRYTGFAHPTPTSTSLLTNKQSFKRHKGNEDTIAKSHEQKWVPSNGNSQCNNHVNDSNSLQKTEVKTPITSIQETASACLHGYRLYHPVMLCTGVKLDESSICTAPMPTYPTATMVNCSSETDIGNNLMPVDNRDQVFPSTGASFVESRCFVWWADCLPQCNNQQQDGHYDIIDGTTGLCCDGSPSRVSTTALCSLGPLQSDICYKYPGYIQAITEFKNSLMGSGGSVGGVWLGYKDGVQLL